MLQEPLLVVGAFYILFFTVIIYVRLDFAITKVRQCQRVFTKKTVFVVICVYTFTWCELRFIHINTHFG